MASGTTGLRRAGAVNVGESASQVTGRSPSRPWTAKQPGAGFTNHLKDLGINHHRIPPRSPNHNAVGERFQGTALQEFYRPAFHRQHLARLADLGAQFQGWLQHYNTRRRNHGDVMRGRTPFAVMEAHIS
jgi:transposase InsO family protein